MGKSTLELARAHFFFLNRTGPYGGKWHTDVIIKQRILPTVGILIARLRWFC